MAKCSIENQRLADLNEIQEQLNITLAGVIDIATNDRNRLYAVKNNVITIYASDRFSMYQVGQIADTLKLAVEKWAVATYGESFRKGWAQVTKGYLNRAVVEITIPKSIEAARQDILSDIDIEETLAEMNSKEFLDSFLKQDYDASDKLLQEQEERAYSFFTEEFTEMMSEPTTSVPIQLSMNFNFDEQSQTNNAKVDKLSAENILNNRKKNC